MKTWNFRQKEKYLNLKLWESRFYYALAIITGN